MLQELVASFGRAFTVGISFSVVMPAHLLTLTVAKNMCASVLPRTTSRSTCSIVLSVRQLPVTYSQPALSFLIGSMPAILGVSIFARWCY